LVQQRQKTLAILVGGGPAPGINGVIRAVTIHAVNSGCRVLGINDGFYWLVQGDAGHHTELHIEQVSRIHGRGGSILRTSRTNPTTSPEKLAATVEALTELGIDYLVTVGGDDTASSAAKVQAASGHRFSVAHVPKTIDNDLPLPGHLPTFGYETARHVGVAITQAILEDAQTTNRWFFLISMGRKAGHLALGIGRAAGATLTIIGEEFRDRTTTLESVADILEAAIIKRAAMGRGFGVAVLAEGIIERLDPEELRRRGDIEHDAHGNIRYGEIELGRMLRTEVRGRLRARGLEHTPLVDKDIGYELRCADPIPFDLEYTQDLGYAAVSYLESGGTGAIVAIERGRVIPVPFESILDPVTGKARIRQVDIDSDSYRVARHYMIRLEAEDFEDPRNVRSLAMAGKLSEQEFESRFRYLTADPPVREEREAKARSSGTQ
jgi:6-phosphofructokinase 1